MYGDIELARNRRVAQALAVVLNTPPPQPLVPIDGSELVGPQTLHKLKTHLRHGICPPFEASQAVCHGALHQVANLTEID
jgi:hypothetical protein